MTMSALAAPQQISLYGTAWCSALRSLVGGFARRLELLPCQLANSVLGSE